MRRFILLRVEDLSGSSGTGIVAKGIVAPNGMVVVCFEDTIKIAPSVEKLMEIHGHEGRTRFHWQDWPKPPPDKPTQRVWEIGVPPTVLRGGALFLVRADKNHVPGVVQWFGNDDGKDPWAHPGYEWSKLQD
jgi:hypothetical protein